jgi:MFS family permease
VLIAAVVGFTVLLLRRRGVPSQDQAEPETPRQAAREIRKLLAEHPALRAFLAANALWELALAAIKSFVVLWLTAGLGYSLSQTSAIIGAVAVVILVAAAFSGKLADRYGRVRILRIALWVYGVGLTVPLFTGTPLLIIPAIPLIAFGGGVTMTLPYALLMPMMPSEQHGSVTGLYSISRGVGIMLGPLLASIAVQLGSGPLSGTHGFAAMWLIAAGAIVGSLPLLARLSSRSSAG